MNQDQLNQKKITTIKEVMDFSKKMLEKQLREIEKELNELQSNFNKLSGGNASLPNSFKVKYKSQEEYYKKVSRDLVEVNNYISRIDAINNSNSLNSTAKFDRISQVVRPFFSDYSNVYGNQSVSIDITKGKSQFKKIMSASKSYEKLSGIIDSLDNKLILLTTKRNIKGKKDESRHQQHMRHFNEALKRQRCRIKGKQQLIMMSRQQVVQKRNKKVSELEIKAELANSKGKTVKEDKFRKKIDKLKTKKIRQKSANVIILTEAVKALLTYRTFDSRGNFDKRNWTERRIDEIEKKGRSI